MSSTSDKLAALKSAEGENGSAKDDTGTEVSTLIDSGDVADTDSTLVREVATVTTELRPADVLIGRGAAVNGRLGNKAFRQVIRSYKSTYVVAPNSKVKHEIAQMVVRDIQLSNGRFLQKIEPPGDSAEQTMSVRGRGTESGASYRILDFDDPVVLEKAKQALREKDSSSTDNAHGKNESDYSNHHSHPTETVDESNTLPPNSWINGVAQRPVAEGATDTPNLLVDVNGLMDRMQHASHLPASGDASRLMFDLPARSGIEPHALFNGPPTSADLAAFLYTQQLPPPLPMHSPIYPSASNPWNSWSQRVPSPSTHQLPVTSPSLLAALGVAPNTYSSDPIAFADGMALPTDAFALASALPPPPPPSAVEQLLLSLPAPSLLAAPQHLLLPASMPARTLNVAPISEASPDLLSMLAIMTQFGNQGNQADDIRQMGERQLLPEAESPEMALLRTLGSTLDLATTSLSTEASNAGTAAHAPPAANTVERRPVASPGGEVDDSRVSSLPSPKRSRTDSSNTR